MVPGIVASSRRVHKVAVATVATLVALVAAPIVTEAVAQPRDEGTNVRVLTRNLFLGGNDAPLADAQNPEELVREAGELLRSVDRTNFPLRARALANEIRQLRPHIVGLQEVALWRTGPPSFDTIFEGPRATEVRYDFLRLLLNRLNRGTGPRAVRYRPVHVQTELDVEGPADLDGDPDTGEDTFGGEVNGRWTMRDVILVRRNAGVRVSKARGGQFNDLLELELAGGVPLAVPRGWNRIIARVRDSVRFRVVNTHLEARDDRTEVPSLRRLQAEQLARGPARPGNLPVVALGDFNSDVPGWRPGDGQAFGALLEAGFKRRSTTDPPSCCVSDLFTSPPSEFDHVVDHVIARPGARVRLLGSRVVGLSQVNGLYPSDHAGVFSRLRIR
jgi:endonuclease/exonuclease/phosphatase family metal-dependent hydrolase